MTERGCVAVSFNELRHCDDADGIHAVTGFAPGDIIWSWVPFDGPGGKDRPCVVLASDGERDALIVAYLTSSDHSDDGDHVFLGYGAWASDSRASWARASRVFRVRTIDIRDSGVSLDRAQLKALRWAVSLHQRSR